jgi:long-chain acyl-CoA synthetase
LPETIQQALLGHPAISAVSAVGVADRRLGQVPAVALELKPGVVGPSFEELEAFLRDHVLATHIPVYWKIVGELPKTVSMKVDRPAVVALFADEVAANA